MAYKNQKFMAGKSSDFFPMPNAALYDPPKPLEEELNDCIPEPSLEDFKAAIGTPSHDSDVLPQSVEMKAAELPDSTPPPSQPETVADRITKKKRRRPKGSSEWQKAHLQYTRIYSRSYKLFFKAIAPLVEPRDRARVLLLLAWNYGLASIKEFKQFKEEGNLPVAIVQAMENGKKPGTPLPLPPKVEDALKDTEEDAAPINGAMEKTERTEPAKGKASRPADPKAPKESGAVQLKSALSPAVPQALEQLTLSTPMAVPVASTNKILAAQKEDESFFIHKFKGYVYRNGIKSALEILEKLDAVIEDYFHE